MAGYSGTPLIQKLGIQPGFGVLVLREPESYWRWLGPLPDDVQIKSKAIARSLDFIHLFEMEYKVFETDLMRYREALKPTGMMWISWPKRSSRVPTDMDENAIRNLALKNELVDIKVCAVDEVWSGLKLVIPVKNRK